MIDVPGHDQKFFRRMQLLGVITAVAFALAGLSLVQSGRERQSRISDNKKVWHAVICSIEQQVIRSGISRDRATKAIAFYDSLLINDVHTSPCG